MIRAGTLLLVGLMLAAALDSCECEPAATTVTGYYEDKPDRSYPNYRFHEQVFLFLRDTQELVDHLSPPGKAQREYLEKSLDNHPLLRAFGEFMSDDDTCSATVIKIARSVIYQYLFNPFNLERNFLDKVLYHGRRKSRRCAMRVRRNFRAYTGVETLHPFDELFGAGINTPSDRYQPATSDQLQSLDFLRSPFSMIRMNEVAKKYEDVKASSLDPYAPLINFLDNKCRALLKTHGDIYSVIKLAKEFGNELHYEDDLSRLKEYNRFCLAWERPETRAEILVNLGRAPLSEGAIEVTTRDRKPDEEASPSGGDTEPSPAGVPKPKNFLQKLFKCFNCDD